MPRMQRIHSSGGNGKRRLPVLRAVRALELAAAHAPAGPEPAMSAAEIARARNDFICRLADNPRECPVCKRGVCSFQRVHELCRHDGIEDDGFCDE